MADDGVDAPLADARAMLDDGDFQLSSIHFERLFIELITHKSPSEILGGESQDLASSLELEVDCSLRTRQVDCNFDLRFDFEVSSPIWRAQLSVVTAYTSERPFVLSDGAPGDFASKVALMAAFPYVREALADLTVRVSGAAVLLPIIRLGELDFRRDSMNSFSGPVN